MPTPSPDNRRPSAKRFRTWLSLKAGRQRRRLTFCLAVGPLGGAFAIAPGSAPGFTGPQAGFVGRPADGDAAYTFFCLPDRIRVYFTIQAVLLALVLAGWFGLAVTALLVALLSWRRGLARFLVTLAVAAAVAALALGTARVLADDDRVLPRLVFAVATLAVPGLVGIVVYGLFRRPVLAGHVLAGLDPRRFGPSIARAAVIREETRLGFYRALFVHMLPFSHCFDRLSAVQFAGPACEQGRYVRLASEQLLPAEDAAPPGRRRPGSGGALPILRWVFYATAPVWTFFVQLSVLAVLPVSNAGKAALILCWVLLSMAFFYLEAQPMLDDLQTTQDDRRHLRRFRTVGGGSHPVKGLLEHTVFFSAANVTLSVLAVLLLSLAQLWGQNDDRGSTAEPTRQEGQQPRSPAPVVGYPDPGGHPDRRDPGPPGERDLRPALRRAAEAPAL